MENRMDYSISGQQSFPIVIPNQEKLMYAFICAQRIPHNIPLQ